MKYVFISIFTKFRPLVSKYVSVLTTTATVVSSRSPVMDIVDVIRAFFLVDQLS